MPSESMPDMPTDSSEMGAKAFAALVDERDQLKARCARLEEFARHISFPPGHFYSPIVDASDVDVIEAARRASVVAPDSGILLNQSAMEAVCERLARHHSFFPFERDPQPGFRFHYGNEFFGAHDASVLFSMLLEHRPARVIEVGCGYSSCLLLDVNERFLDRRLRLTLIDPQLDQLRATRPLGDVSGATLIEARLQEVPLSVFRQLQANDILFLDSSHVLKTASDVNRYLFEILPTLADGVFVHIHDILYPFEYPETWILREHRSWNETYAVRAFLQYNSVFPIYYWTNFAYHAFAGKLGELMPLCLENEGGSLWLRKDGQKIAAP